MSTTGAKGSVGARNRLTRWLTYAALILLGTVFTLPFFWLVSTSFKPPDRIQIWPPDILPMQHVKVRVAGRMRQVCRAPGVGPAGLVAVLGGESSERTAVAVLDKDLRPVGRAYADADRLTQAVRPGVQWSNYTRGLRFVDFGRQLRNTLVVCFFTVLGTLISSSLVAYGLARIPWNGRGVLFMVILSTMMLPYQVIMVPLFALFVRLGWVDTFLPLTVPAFFGNAFFIFLLRQFFLTIPQDLSEAAKIDGCGEFDIYRRIILPLSKPALAMVGLWTFMGSWNDFLGPLIYLADESRYTLSLGLAMFLGEYGSEYGMLMAVSTVVTIPILILFFFTQRTFIQGITLTGLKQ